MKYILNQRDEAVCSTIRSLLEEVRTWDIDPAHRLTLARLSYVIDRMPRVTEDLEIAIAVSSPEISAGAFKACQVCRVEVENGLISLSLSGFLEGPNGGDSFTAISWSACPGGEAEYQDYRHSLWMVPGIRSLAEWVERLDFNEIGCDLSEVRDPGNEFLDLEDEDDDDAEEDREDEEDEDEWEDEEHAGDEEEDGVKNLPWTCTPVEKIEQFYAGRVDAAEVNRRRPQYAYGVDQCGQCGISLDAKALFVDGRFRDQSMWGNFCVSCFDALGQGIGWGDGQLYARQPDGKWRMVAGWSSSDDDP